MSSPIKTSEHRSARDAGFEAREVSEHLKDQSTDARRLQIRMFGNTVGSITHYVDHALGLVELACRCYEEQLAGLMSVEGKKELGRVFAELRREIGTIREGIDSMRRFSELVCNKYHDPLEKRREGR
jgi:hypothetical protein